ncbi:MAG: enolase C-terminal domain-like protein [Pseudomonadota bacterium]
MPEIAPTIASINVRAVTVPMTPHKTASGVVSESPLVLIDITDSEGTVGHGLLFTYTAAALKPVAEFVSNLAPLLNGQSSAPQSMSDTLSAKFRLLGTQGLVGMALAGIDMALWDLHARRNDQSLLQVLGVNAKPIPCYGGVGYDGEVGSAKCAEAWAKMGMRGVKAKIGYPTVTEDLAVIRAMRSAIGDDLSIMVDYNQSLTPVEAIARIREFDDENLVWVEEPTLAHDYAGHALIRSQVRTPVQCGENWWGPLDMQHAIDHEASDYMMPDAMKIGGVTGWMRAAALAKTRGIRLSSHLWPEISAQLLCATPTAHWLEYVDWWNPIIAEPLRIKDGYADLDGVIGSGLDWNAQSVRELMS